MARKKQTERDRITIGKQLSPGGHASGIYKNDLIF